MEIFLGAFTREWEQRRAAYLHERLIGGTSGDDEEERRRRGTAAGGGIGNRVKGERRAARESVGRSGPTSRSMATRFSALAGGSQPAVVKMTSFGGGGRLGAMASYISRNGDVPMENEAGEELRGRDAIAGLSDGWAHLMSNRAESRDIGTFRIDVDGGPGEGQPLYAWAREIIKTALGDRSFAFVVEEDHGQYRIDGVVVLRDKTGERLTADAKAEEIVQGRIGGHGGSEAELHFTGYGNGVEYGTARLRKLVEQTEGVVQDDRGETIADVRQAGNLAQLQWRGELYSRKPRDIMHLVMSARAGTDVEAFRAAAREFLASEFGRHRYVFSLHDPSKDPKAEPDGGKRPHVHIHAIVAMRSEDGERIETSIASFRRWREGLAEQARAHGIRMEMTDRRDQANAASYTRNQVRPVSHKGRTEHEGTSDSAALRYELKRREAETAARTSASRGYAEAVHKEWSVIIQNSDDADVKIFAKEMILRLEAARRPGDPARESRSAEDISRSLFQTELIGFFKLAEIDNMSTMTRSEFEAYEKRVETALFRAERIMPETERSNFEEIAAAAREHVDVRREMMEEAEQSEERRTDGAAPREDRANRQWDEAVARHGLKTVEAGNDIMIEVEHYRERIELADDDEIRVDKASLQASLNFELARAGELGAAGNAYIREVAEVDEELRVAIVAAERSRERARERGDGFARDEGTDSGRPEREDGDGKREGYRHRGGDEHRTDPAKQQVPRLEELQQEADREHKRDEAER